METVNFGNWKRGNKELVRKAFDYAYMDGTNRLLPIIGEIDEKEPFSGSEFKPILIPGEYNSTEKIAFKQCKINKLDECKEVGARLGNGVAMTVQDHIMRLFSNAFSDEHKGSDGVSWANAAHPVASKSSHGRVYVPNEEAGTYSNLITDQLSVAAITKAQSMARRFVTPDGLPFLCNIDCILVSPELEATAKKLLGENTNCGMSYIVVGGSHGGFSDQQWALCDRRLMKKLVKLVWDTRPTVLQIELDNPLIDQYTGYADFSIGWGDARQIIFSNP